MLNIPREDALICTKMPHSHHGVWDQVTPAVNLSPLCMAFPNSMFIDSHIGTLKSVKVKVFTPRKLVNPIKKAGP